ncbi:uncharacterized protein [Blastocystis hominis]|uniref:DNA polymerase delta subunit OB-fold domain-containing protein n=1 Tax=Blastocystis hominis TaxID=12968 RepID=D8M2Z0_BLAHO|nr:uncharacterized protein [Blastocystis hominis]CBK22713.2 unnamed protein product [Blastocystis hominis]|eukprot:XP_012896761.1 uncharacterized protein [Blastocystis hominis]
MKPLLIDACKRKWGDTIPIVEEIRNVKCQEDCIIIGTIYKDLSLFKSILNEKVSSAFNPQLIGTQFLPKNSLHGPLSQEGDPIILEDSTTRIMIKDFKDPIVTGVVMAIRGEVRVSLHGLEW